MAHHAKKGSAGGQAKKGKKIVGFSQGNDTVDTQNRPRSGLPSASFSLDVTPPAAVALDTTSPSHSRRASGNIPSFVDRSHLPELSPEITSELRAALAGTPQPRPVRPALRRGNSSFNQQNDSSDFSPGGTRTPQEFEAKQAYERGKRLERHQQASSTLGSRAPSPAREQINSHDGVPEISLQTFDNAIESDSDENGNFILKKHHQPAHQAEAEKLVKSHTGKAHHHYYHTPPPEYRSGVATPTEERSGYEFHVPKPDKMRGGVLGMLLSLYNQDEAQGRRPAGHSRRSSSVFSSSKSTPNHSPTSSGTSTPVTPATATRKSWYGGSSKRNGSTTSLAKLVGSSSIGATHAVSGLGAQVAQRIKEQQAQEKARAKKRSPSSGAFSALKGLSQARPAEEFRITVHIAETIARQRYLEKLCRALMENGAPTHRLEEYMKMSARVLEIEAQFLYIPGSMIISFDDSQTHTAAVRLVRATQGLDLGKLRDVHELYKEVVHDRLGVEEATRRLHDIRKRPQKYNKWLLVLVCGLASASVGPFAFGARLIDLPIAFFLGALVGVLQLVIAPRSDLYSNVFEVTAVVATSFLARAFGSIRGGNLFCFSALAQSAIALILPGYTVLCASLELQSRSMVAGSVRMVYAVIYSLFLGFGIMVGTAIYGRIDPSATSATTCENSIQAPYTFIAVPIFTVCLIVINQGKWKQMPVMVTIAFAGFVTSFYTAKRFSSNTQIANTVSSFVIGVMANLYSRVGKRCESWCLDQWEDRIQPRVGAVLGKITKRAPGVRLRSLANLEAGQASSAETEKARLQARKGSRHVGYGLAAAAMLPGIFVQVPSGLAASGSLVSGLATANQINSKTNSTTGSTTQMTSSLDSLAFGVSISVVQIAIGITVGLFLAAIVVYPSGKRRSGLFSF
ncbi:DUF1212-domain-containing protein [Myriangium duriaei CBS 260.36]|uniref:DUF1212-domain-containing protein n=1 Tax=Myriangium duriaei CBS 260.36 TaxID=1168546 RepID=A0A9P4J8P1_9PEZI|nr:DUF1212-domain-containing protein [Myriangium duriaei CBS 260.36]